MGNSEESVEITTLGISATIMILYNMIAWPYIHELTDEKMPITKIVLENDRAWAVVNQVDIVVGYCSSIMTMIKNLSKGDE